MSVPPTVPGNLNTPPPANESRLESWGEIALYLRRDIRTVQRWEKNSGLPVRRFTIGKQDQVYAYRSELDNWMLGRQPKPGDEKTTPENDGKDETYVSPDLDLRPPIRWTWLWAAAGMLLLAALAAAVGFILKNNRRIRFA